MNALVKVKADSLLLAIAAYQARFCSARTNTGKAKSADLRWLSKWVSERLGQSATAHDLSVVVAQQILSDMEGEGAAPDTIIRRRATFSSFCKLLKDLCPGFINPWPYVKGPRKAATTPQWHTTQEEEQLRAIRHGKDVFEEQRNRLILLAGLDLGLRCHEIARLEVGQITGDLKMLRKVRRKGGLVVDMPISPEMQELLTYYLPLRELSAISFGYLTSGPRSPLFFTDAATDMQAISVKTIYRLALALGRKARVDGCHPHRWRHTAIRRYYEATLDLLQTQAFACHASPTMTSRYAMCVQDDIAVGLAEVRRKRLNKQENDNGNETENS